MLKQFDALGHELHGDLADVKASIVLMDPSCTLFSEAEIIMDNGENDAKREACGQGNVIQT